MRHSFRAVALAGLACVLSSSSLQADVNVGDEPSFDVTGTDGAALSLKQYRGKIVIIDFWATWCGPCMAEAAHMVQLHKQFGPEGVQLIGISLDDDEAKLKSVVKDKGFDWPQFYDGNGWKNQLAVEWGVKSIPATYIINPEGKVVWKGHPANIDAALAKAMRDTPPMAIDPALAKETASKLDEIESLLADAPEKALNLLGTISPDVRKLAELNTRIGKVQSSLAEHAKTVLADAEKLVTEKSFVDAAAKFASIVTAMSGTEAGKLASDKLAALDAHPEFIAQKAAAKKAEEEAALLAKSSEALKSAQALQTKKRHEDAYAAFKAIVRTFPNTPAAATAAQSVAIYDKDAAFIRQMNDKAAKEKAEGMLSLARNYARSGSADTAKRKYKEIWTMFPNTTYAETAQKEAAALDTQKKK